MQRILPLSLILLITVGCSNEPPKLTAAKPVEKTPTVVIPQLERKPAPQSSDPAAKKIVDAAIAAHTHGYPERIDKLRSMRLTRKGRIGPPQHWPVESVVTMRWPGEIHVRSDVGDYENLYLCCTGDFGMTNMLPGQPPRLEPKSLVNLRQDFTGEWLWLLYPLTLPETILAPANDEIIDGTTCEGVRVWVPNLSDAVLYFDKTSHLLKGVLFIGSEQDDDILKLFTIHTTAEFEGIIMPKTMTQRSEQTILFEWTFETIETDPKIEDGLFKGEQE